MKKLPEFDVIVVGAGPAGSACASILSRHGMSVLVLEKSRFPRDKICGDCVNPSAWHLFDLLGVAHELRAGCHRTIDHVRIANCEGRTVTFSIPSDPSSPPFSVKRKILDDILLKNASRAGATVIQECRIVNLEKQDCWRVIVEHEQGRREFSARFLIGADGRNSFVASRIGARTTHLVRGNTGVRIGVQWHAKFQPFVNSDVCMFKFNQGYAGVVNVDDQTSNVAMVAESGFIQLAHSNFSGFMERTVSTNPSWIPLAREIAPLGGISITYPVDPFIRKVQRSDAFLIGDARRTFEPFTGEGVCFALQDGIQTAYRILEVSGRSSAPYRIRKRNSFWVNKVYSPLLRSHRGTETMVNLVARRPRIAEILAKTVF